jgi:glycine/D-amino acid oxidase-like deaminating enzyme
LDLKRFSEIDFILVGQGIAGSILAYLIIKAGKKVLVFDTPQNNHSSVVAAGLFNPVTGRKFVKTWMAEHLFPFLIHFYQNLERDLDSEFFHPMPIFRPFLSLEEKNAMISRYNAGGLEPFVDQILSSPPGNFPPPNDLGGIKIKHSGYVNLPRLLDSLKDFIRSNGKIREELFDHKKMEITEKGIGYKDLYTEKVIFCEGSQACNNPYFRWLPFRPVKGEILTIDAEIHIDFIFNRKIFILPLQEGLYRVGATYDWDYRDMSPTEEAKKYLEEKLNQFFPVNYKVVNHLAGIRPATKDRRPFVGLHPELPKVGIFNGLGSKGVTLSPYFAHQFVDYLLKDEELDKEVNINRFY